MGYVLDLIIVVMFGLIVFFAVKNGFVKSFIGSISLIAAIVITILLFPALRTALAQTDIAARTDNAITQKLTEICPKGESFDSDALIKDKPGEFMELLDRYGIDIESLTDKYDEWITQGVDDVSQSVVGFISSNAVNFLVSALTFIILFFGTLIVLKLVTFIIDRFCQLPGLKTANRILGLVFGLVCGILAVCTFTAIVSLFMPYLATLGVEIDPESTFVFKYLWGDSNVLLKILS